MKVLRRLFVYLMALGISVLGIRLFGMLPGFFPTQELTRYYSLSEVRHERRFGRVVLPAYFPQSLNWPPEEIFAQSRPGPMVLMHFTKKETGQIEVAVQQSSVDLNEMLAPRIQISNETDVSQMVLDDVDVQHVTGFCEDLKPCQSLSWQSDGKKFLVVSKGLERDLFRMVKSMID